MGIVGLRRDRSARAPDDCRSARPQASAHPSRPGSSRARRRARELNGEEMEMRRVMVRYKVKPERAAENEELVRAVYAELHETRPAGLRYATFKLDDGVSFVHLAETTRTARVQLSQLAAFKRFQDEHRRPLRRAPGRRARPRSARTAYSASRYALSGARVRRRTGAGLGSRVGPHLLRPGDRPPSAAQRSRDTSRADPPPYQHASRPSAAMDFELGADHK